MWHMRPKTTCEARLALCALVRETLEGVVSRARKQLGRGEAKLVEDFDALSLRADKLEHVLRRHIRIHRVADEAWNPDAEVERLFRLEMGE